MASDQGSRTTSMSLQLADVSFDVTGTSLLCHAVVPESWRQRVFDAIHGLSHPGRKPSQRLIAARFVWHGLWKDIRDWVNTYTIWPKRAKVYRHVKAPLEMFEVPEKWFDHVNVDLVGPFPPSRGVTYLLTMVDRTTRWREAVPLASTTTADVARAFIGTWVTLFGAPLDLSSD
ncbi:hypothetical protein AAFF_G00190310 [Aldrovandia affinis]|uniref:Gypsy retrotransposon integrase-like protein 1 n=1 Tax=Aldrovandia affinis TaxID=143900 RepID=A0AAD7RJL5_9TELE|nr:hypothetical protein AAFF_G00190310 [Aldrovandia affinis]